MKKPQRIASRRIAPRLTAVVDSIASLTPYVEKSNGERSFKHLCEDDWHAVLGILTDVFTERGLKEDDEPNGYGLEIEELIGVVSANLWPT